MDYRAFKRRSLIFCEEYSLIPKLTLTKERLNEMCINQNVSNKKESVALLSVKQTPYDYDVVLMGNLNVSRKWMREVDKTLQEGIQQYGRMTVLRVDFNYSENTPAEGINPSNEDIMKVVQRIKKKIAHSTCQLYHYVLFREFGKETRKKHYHGLFFLTHYHPTYRIPDMIHTVWHTLTGGRAWFKKVITLDKTKENRQSTKEVHEWIRYLCKLETKISDGNRNYITGRGVGIKNGDASTSPMNSKTIFKEEIISRDTQKHTSHANKPYNACPVINNTIKKTLRKRIKQLIDRYQKSVLVSVKLCYPSHVDGTHYKKHIESFHQQCEKVFGSEHGYSGLLSQLIKLDNGERYHQALLSFSGHKMISPYYYKINNENIYTLIGQLWKTCSCSPVVAIELVKVKALLDRSQFRLAKHYQHLVRTLLSPFLRFCQSCYKPKDGMFFVLTVYVSSTHFVNYRY